MTEITISGVSNPKANRISPTPANTLNTTGALNVHLTMPIELKNSDISGLMTRQPTNSND